jgi:hypothetical protein
MTEFLLFVVIPVVSLILCIDRFERTHREGGKDEKESRTY